MRGNLELEDFGAAYPGETVSASRFQHGAAAMPPHQRLDSKLVSWTLSCCGRQD
jgi:hypothetical protein